MITPEQLAEIEKHMKLTFDNLTGARFTELISTLSAALKVVKAAQSLTLNKTLPHNWKGDPVKSFYQVDRKGLAQLLGALEPFNQGVNEGKQEERSK